MLDTSYSHAVTDGNPYNLRVIPAIKTISAHMGSSSGGLEITIEGKGFPKEKSRINADIGGNPAVVLKSSYFEIKILT